MREIAHHFALDRHALIDAYEVVIPPPDIDPGVVPTIVHINGDVLPESSNRLILLDIEYHAHRIEAHFRSGPLVIRHVVLLLKRANRNEVLATAKIDKYCRAEGGRCLVFINSRRWPDYDLDRKTIAHGDYIKIAIPPSDRFACPTQTIADMTQRGLSDQEVYDEMLQDETASGFSPDLLDVEEIRSLARTAGADHDAVHLMQTELRNVEAEPEVPTPHSDHSFEDPIPYDWFLDMQRIVAPLARCGEDEQQEFIFSVYTWLVDHHLDEICREPKIVVLGGDPAEWAEDIRQPWKHRILHDDHVFMDVVQPVVRRSGIEEHIAHIILTKNHDSRSSILTSIEFVDEVSTSVIVRFALTLPKECSLVEVIAAVPLLSAFVRNKREWVTPSHQDEHLPFRTRSGMGLFVKVFQFDETQLSAVDGDENSMLHLSAAYRDDPNTCLADAEPNPDPTQSEHSGDNLIESDLSCQNKRCRAKQGITVFSLTEEFIRYVQAVGSQVDGTGPPIEVPNDLLTQPVWIQDIWEKWVETRPQSDEFPQEGPRIETWFSNPQRWSRCRESRLVVLSPNFHFWERELLAAWPDKAGPNLPTQFALVFPTPEDADRTAQEQIVIEQQSEPFSRTIVATLYDTHIDAGRPHSIALVVGDRFDLRSFILLMGYNEECPPETLQNECLMWMGNIAIRHDQTVNVRLGNAFRLLVRRGIRVSLQELLSMSDHRLREELQSAISGQVYRRPNLQGFPADAFANNNPTTPGNQSLRPNDDYPPDWLNSLQECFGRYATCENSDEGRVMYVLVWFLNGRSCLRNESPQVVRLDADNAWWRTELVFPWREMFGRGSQAEIHFIDPIPVKEVWHSHAAHVVISQSLPMDHVPVVVTKVESSHAGQSTIHTALVVHQYSSAQDIARRFDIADLGPNGFTVSRGRNKFPHEFAVRIGPGDGLYMQVQPNSLQAGSSQSPRENGGLGSLRLTHIGPEGTDENIDDHQVDEDLEDALLMQAFQCVHRRQPNELNNSCALGLSNETPNEGHAFQFNPAAAEFLPSINALPAWAEVIEDIYHDWDVRAFAWQGEARATHFMTWYLAPGRDRLQCLHGRRVVLFADFWNWREQLCHHWIDELDPAAEIDIAYVSPPPTQMEAGITGHILLIQHNSVEWSSVLISVFDQAVNAGHPYHMAHSFLEQVQFQQVVNRIGYADECLNRAQCQFRIRGQLFAADNHILASDGDAIDVLVHRVVVPMHWNPPIIPHMPGAEGLALLQKRARIISRTDDTRPCAQTDSLQKRSISLVEGLGNYTSDIESIPFTLEKLFQNSSTRENDLVICIWEMHESVDIQMCPISQFDEQKSKLKLCHKHALIKVCSNLFPVNFSRNRWAIGSNRWYVGSYVQQDHDHAILACVEYELHGATATVKTLPKKCRTDLLRLVLNIRWGTLIRLNGKFVGEEVTFANGDLIEYHIGHRAEMKLQMQSQKVQVCLDATIENVVPHFEVDEEAFEMLPLPPVQQMLRNGEVWKFEMIPEATLLHKETFEALHMQNEVDTGTLQKYELYIDGATSQSRSAWAVVAVRVSDNGRHFMGCVAGVTEINRHSDKWIGASAHTNIDAELSAMVVATSFAYFASADIQVTIRPDLALSERFFNLQSTTRQQSTIAKVIHVLGQAQPEGIDIEEVRAHQGDPWNELADAIAKQVALTGNDVGKAPWHMLNQIANSSSTVKWEWLRYAPPSYCQTMPVLHGEAVWQPTSQIHESPC